MFSYDNVLTGTNTNCSMFPTARNKFAVGQKIVLKIQNDNCYETTDTNNI